MREEWPGVGHAAPQSENFSSSKELLSISRTTTEPWPEIADLVTFPKRQMPGADEKLN